MTTLQDILSEVQGLGKGLGSVGAKISKSAGLPGVDVSTNTKPLKPPQQAPQQQEAPPEDVPPGDVPPEEMPIEDPGPETVEELPKPEKLEYDAFGMPNKERLIGHTVNFDGREYALDWDPDVSVYKLVDPDTLVVRTRVKPSQISTVDFRESIEDALRRVEYGVPPGVVVEQLLRS